MILSNDTVSLRALEPEDIDFLFSVENTSSFWEVSETIQPYAKHILRNYLQNAHLDIYQTKQLRLVVEDKSNIRVGFIDLFDFNPIHLRVGVGILILPQYQRQHFAAKALSLIIEYAKQVLHIHQLHAGILESNIASIGLFKQLHFEQAGIQKDWVKGHNGEYQNQLFFQRIL